MKYGTIHLMKKDLDYYLQRGFDQKTAEYYISGRRQVVAVEADDQYRLHLEFDNGERRILDCNSLFQGNTVFAAIHSPESYRRVYLDADHVVSWDIDPAVDSTSVWSNKLDLCPDSCYLDSIPA